MGIFISLIVITGFVSVFCFIARRAMAFRKLLDLKGFKPHEKHPEHLDSICEDLFDCRISSGFYYRAGEDSEWGKDSWVVDVDSGGGDDPSQQVLFTEKISPKSSSELPEFVMALTEGITSVKCLRILEPEFLNTGLRLLPDSFQPFLRKRKGLVVYSNNEFDLKSVVTEKVISALRSGGYGGAAFYEERIVVWTYAEANPEKLFAVANELKEQMIRNRKIMR